MTFRFFYILPILTLMLSPALANGASDSIMLVPLNEERSEWLFSVTFTIEAVNEDIVIDPIALVASGDDRDGQYRRHQTDTARTKDTIKDTLILSSEATLTDRQYRIESGDTAHFMLFSQVYDDKRPVQITYFITGHQGIEEDSFLFSQSANSER